MTAAIELSGVGKCYRKLEERPTLLRTLLPLRREAHLALWALRDLDLRVGQGETVAVVGQNGAGKTTLLRLLAGVTSPTVGRVRVNGRIGPLIGLGVGFHAEMSGRENVLVNGMLLGLTAKEVQARFDAIVEFAELRQFIDTPVKFYSSGMFARLGFAVIAHIDPTILLVDEILAVGDARFQLKCFDRIRALQADGATVVMVSHAMHMIRQLCRRGVMIRHGRLEYDGDLEGAIAAHERSVLGDARPDVGAPVALLDRRFARTDGDACRVGHEEPVDVILRLRFNQRIEDPVITVGAIAADGLLTGFNSTPVGGSWRTFGPGEEAVVRIGFPARLAGGTYRLAIEVKDRAGAERLARSDDLILEVAERSGATGVADLCAEIDIARAVPDVTRR
jgi:lipopolysaccharide transport system ATP-binding protein